MELPQLPPRTCRVHHPDRGIGLVGCGQIAPHHLRAYRAAGYRVRALANPTIKKAEALRDEYYPGATVHHDHRALLEDPRIEVVDVTTHPDVRTPILRDCLDAGRHVLSQKPFVTDLATGVELCDLADSRGALLAVNQNGRFSPHYHWIVSAIRAGLIGEPRSMEVSIHWDHSWVAGTQFDTTEHLILFDFGIHWLDIATLAFSPDRALEVTAREYSIPDQRTRQPMGARASVRFSAGVAEFEFNGAHTGPPTDRTRVEGSEGVITSQGPDLQQQSVTLTREGLTHSPELDGQWFDDGFHGSMAELLGAIDAGRSPSNSARNNLSTLALAFAACRSATEDQAVASVRPTPS